MKPNITMIGMPSSGKSTVGVLLAKRLGFSFIDVDIVIQIALIARKHGMVSRVSREFFQFFPNYFAN